MRIEHVQLEIPHLSLRQIIAKVNHFVWCVVLNKYDGGYSDTNNIHEDFSAASLPLTVPHG